VSIEQIRVGIAGLGRSGWGIHSRLLGELETLYNVVAVTDNDPARREEGHTRFGCRMYDHFDEMLLDENIELVVVALPTFLHAEASIAALEAGKHVVCEKPMATTLADADRMIAADQRTDGVLSAFQNRRYEPDYLKVQEVVESGILGRIVQINMSGCGFSRRWDWQTLKEYGGGSLNNTAVHYLDQALQLFGDGQPEIFCHMERALTLGDAEDHVKVVLHGEGAPLIDVEISSASAYSPETWRISGTQGGLAGSASDLRWKWFDPATLVPRNVDTRPTPDRSYNHESYDWQEGAWHRKDYKGPGQKGYYLDLFETIRRGKPLAVTLASVRRVIWVLAECHRLAPVE